MGSYQAFDANQLKHLEMIQSVIARLAGNSFLIKGWAITVAGAFAGLGLSSRNRLLVVGGIISTVFFWSLDAYFLRSERLFRALYDQVRIGDEKVEAFYMGATHRDFKTRVQDGDTIADSHSASWIKTARSLTLSLLYVAILITSSLVILFIPQDSSREVGRPARPLGKQPVSHQRHSSEPRPHTYAPWARFARSHPVATGERHADEGGTHSARLLDPRK